MPSMPLDALAPDQRAVVQLVLQRERSYEAFQDDELGTGSLIAFIAVTLIGAILTPVFTLIPGADDLQEVAWSAPFQTT